jgi:hypothetical protein
LDPGKTKKKQWDPDPSKKEKAMGSGTPAVKKARDPERIFCPSPCVRSDHHTSTLQQEATQLTN